jgi:hypothetical protein
MQINKVFQFGQSFCVEWRRFYFINVPKIPPQSLESTGPIPLLNTVLNYVQDITEGLHTSEQSRRIQRLYSVGLKLYMKLFRNMASMKMTSRILMKLALQWDFVQHPRLLLQWIAVKDPVQLFKGIMNGLQSLNV